MLFCGDEACDNREDHKRAADEHADNLHGLAVLDAIDKLVEFFKAIPNLPIPTRGPTKTARIGASRNPTCISATDEENSPVTKSQFQIV